MLKVLVPAAILAMLASGSVMAAPGASSTSEPKGATASDVVQAQYHPGRRYDRAPHNWHRYDRRPGDWRRRGCVIVGPVWFCP